MTVNKIGQNAYHDFGYVLAGSQLRRDFVIENDTARPCRLVSLKTTCGCTAAEPSRKTVNPGERLVIPVHFKPGRKPQRKTHYVRLRFSPGFEEQMLTVSAVVRASMTLRPDVCRAILLPGETGTVSAVIENYSDFSFRLSKRRRRSTSRSSSTLRTSAGPLPQRKSA